jgi:acyl carrier protein
MHAREAAAVYSAAERLGRERLGDLDLDTAVERILGQSSSVDGRDSVDLVEQLMAIEEEFGSAVVDAETEATRSLLSDAVFRALLVTSRSNLGGVARRSGLAPYVASSTSVSAGEEAARAVRKRAVSSRELRPGLGIST